MSWRWRAIDVVLDDINKDALAKALERIDNNMHRQAARGLIKDDQIAPAMKRIRATHSARRHEGPRPRHRGGDRGRSDQEEDLPGAVSAPRAKTLLATNTSSISITRLATATDRPERFIGIHFMNPVPVMQLVEVIRGIATDDTTFQAALGDRQARRQDRGLCRGLPGLHRQPHPAADDQRGGLHAL